MKRPQLRARSPQLIAGFGAILFLVAVAHHRSELTALEGAAGPAAAMVLDGVPALGVVYAGYRLAGTELSPDNRWTVAGWCLGGAALIGGVMTATVLVRAAEGRAIAEPAFPLLVATEAGAIAGLVAGYNEARARADARRAEATSDAFAFVNDLIRHDLRNDLTVIRGYAGAAATESTPDRETDGTAVIVEKADEALARIETTDAVAETLLGDPALEPVDLVAVADEMATRVADAFDVDVTTDLPDRAPVTANAGLRSVVDNLLENAAEHNDADDPRLRVAVTVDGDTARLTVRDNGPGIPDARTETVFDPGEDGRGGLSLVRTLVTEYDGDVRVADNDPRGSVFTVELPRASAAERDTSEPTAADTGRGSR